MGFVWIFYSLEFDSVIVVVFAFSEFSFHLTNANERTYFQKQNAYCAQLLLHLLRNGICVYRPLRIIKWTVCVHCTHIPNKHTPVLYLHKYQANATLSEEYHIKQNLKKLSSSAIVCTARMNWFSQMFTKSLLICSESSGSEAFQWTRARKNAPSEKALTKWYFVKFLSVWLPRIFNSIFAMHCQNAISDDFWELRNDSNNNEQINEWIICDFVQNTSKGTCPLRSQLTTNGESK